MKKLLFAAMTVLFFAACSHEKSYTIEGSFDIPETYTVGDTVISRGPLEGYVYLFGLDGEAIDSVKMENEKFTFTGIVNDQMPYFAYVVSEYGAGMFAVEPGVIKAVIGDPVVVTGTPINDAIATLMTRVDEIGVQLYEELQSSADGGDEETVSQTVVMEMYNKYGAVVNSMVDSVYHANEENLIGVYCANVMSVQARSTRELEEIIAPLSDYVKNSELIQQHFLYLKEAESQYQQGGEDNIGD